MATKRLQLLGKFAGSSGSGVGIENVEQTTTSNESGGTNVITVTLTDGSQSTFAVQNGAKGDDGYTPQKGVDYFDGQDGKDGENGKDGADGYTPVKGTDYFTETDKQEIINEIFSQVIDSEEVAY